MKMSMKKSSVIMVVLMVLLSLTAAYAAPAIANGNYYSDEFSIAIWKDGQTLPETNETQYSMANQAVVPHSHELNVSNNGGSLTFDIQPFEKWGIKGYMTSLKVDFGNGYVDADFSGDTVTLAIPVSELTAENHLYPAKVENSVVGIPMKQDIEFYIDLSDCY